MELPFRLQETQKKKKTLTRKFKILKPLETICKFHRLIQGTEVCGLQIQEIKNSKNSVKKQGPKTYQPSLNPRSVR